MIDITWTVPYCEFDFETDPGIVLITNAYWKCHGVDPNTGNEAEQTGGIDLTAQKHIYTEADVGTLSSDDILEWVWEAMGAWTKSQYEDAVTNDIEEQNKPSSGGFVPT